MPAELPVRKDARRVKKTPSLFHLRGFSDELLIDAVSNPRLSGKRANFVKGNPLYAAVLIGLYAQIIHSGIGLRQIRHVQMQMRAHIRTTLLVPGNRKHLNGENLPLKQQLRVSYPRFLLKLAQCHCSKIGFAIGMPANP